MENEQIQRLLDINPDPVFIAERKSGRILFFNKVFIRRTNSGTGSFIKNLFDIVPDSEREKLNSLLGGTICDGEFHFRLDDGQKILKKLYTQEFGSGTVLISIEEEAGFTKTGLPGKLIDDLNDAVISTNLKMEITSWNKAAERIYGWMENEALGVKIDSLLQTEVTESQQKKYLMDIDIRGTVHRLVTQRHKNTNPIFIEAKAISMHDSSGKVNGYIYVNRDITSKLATLEQLNTSEERYKKIFDENPMPIVIYREDDYSIVKANRAAEKRYGYPVEEIERMKITDFLPPEEIERFLKISGSDQRETREGNFYTLEKSGKRVYIEYTSTRISYKGHSSRMVVINDITEKQKAEAKMRESSGKLNTIVSNLPMILLELDENGMFVIAEGKAVYNLGFLPGELTGKSAYDVAGEIEVTQHNGEAMPVKDMIPRVLNGEIIAGHTEMAGRYFDNYFVPIKRESEKVNGMLGVCLDITERVNFEKSFRNTEERFMLIAENTSELISMVSEGKYLYLSPSYEKVLGYSLDEIREMTPMSLVHPEDKTFLQNWQEIGMAEFRVMNKRGNWLWMEGESFRIPGDPAVVVGIAREVTKRKLAEEGLKDSEERYRILFERNPLPMFVRDEKTMHFLAVNEAAVRHYGYTKEEFLNMTIRDVHPEEDIPLMLRTLAHQQQGMNKLGVWKHRKKDGTLIDVDVTTYNIVFKGRPARIVLANDVTEKVKAEKALRLSEEKYRRIVEYANEGILLMDTDTRITFVNPKLAETLGFRKEEVEGLPILSFVYEDDIDKATDYIVKNREGVDESFEFRVKHKDGAERWVSVNAVPIFNEDYKYDGGLAFITDITHQRETEEGLQRTNEMLRALINYSPLSIIILDKDGKTELWNPASEKIFGWNSKEVMGRMLPTVPPEKAEEHAALRKMIMDGNSFTGKEVIRIRKNGKKINVSISASPLFDSEHHTIGISSFLMDITDRKIAEREREKLFKQINSARNRLKILSAKLISVQEVEKRNISRELHDEIGQSLTAIKINLQRIKNDTISEETISLIDDCTALVEKTISGVRNLSLDLRPAIIDDLGLAASLRWYTDRFYQRTGIKVKSEIHKVEEVLPSECAITLFRICQEALTNIAKHAEADYVMVSLNQKKNFITLTIEDNGKGFDLQKALKMAAKGKSLGLLGMQERAELLGGRFKITSNQGHGTLIKATCQV